MAALALAAVTAVSMGIGQAGAAGAKNKYQATWLDLFDTVTMVTGYAESEEEFKAASGAIYEELAECDRLYDIYNEYPDTVNLCTINSHPGETFEADQRIIDLLEFAREADEFSGHKTDVMLGAVLKIWHEAREDGIAHPESAHLPDTAALEAAAEHVGFDLIEIDAEKRTVRITDPEASLDVGAVAKGYAVQRVCALLPEGYLLSAGGNVAATGPKPDGSSWTIGVQDPDFSGEGYLHRIGLASGAAVTSGDYQRYYTVDGTDYHHIIDPETLFPAEKWRGNERTFPFVGPIPRHH